MGKAGLVPLVLGTLAVAAGAAFLVDVGALPGMATRNVVAFALGLGAGWLAHVIAHSGFGAPILFALATAVLALVLLVGIEADGVRRWLAIGPLAVQPALALAPLLLAIVASREGRHWRALILLPLLLVALQPDAATLAGLTAGIAVLMTAASWRSPRGWTARRVGIALGALSLAVLGLVIAGIQTPPPVAFVEGTIDIARTSGAFATLLHGAAILLMAGALIGARGPQGLALAAYFVTAAVVAAFWAFPMPVVGAGPSHLLGFGIAIGWLAKVYARAKADC